MPFITKKLHSPIRQMALTFLQNELALTRSEAQRLITRGRLTCNDIVMDDQFGFIEGDCEFICFEPLSRGFKPMLVTNDFAVYDKPSGLSVHPHSRLSPYTLNDEIKHLFGDDANATHRIDQETSGLVLVSRHKKSESVLKKLFSERLISKRYRAMVKGHVSHSIEIREPLFRHDHPNLLISMVVKVDPRGKPAHTIINPLCYFPEHDITLVEAIPLTGRTHQIRVHLFHVKHPIIGDPVYGPEERDVIRFIKKELLPADRLRIGGSTRLLLHAHSLEFEYDNKKYTIESEKDFLKECFESMKINHISLI